MKHSEGQVQLEELERAEVQVLREGQEQWDKQERQVQQERQVVQVCPFFHPRRVQTRHQHHLAP